MKKIRIKKRKYLQISSLFSNVIHGKEDRSLDEIVAEISQHLEEFEEELKIRGTDFFGGDENTSVK